jgi:hypothetical protein
VDESIRIERSIGKNLWSVMSQTLAKSNYEVFKEFVSNSYDADAEHVSITVNTLDDRLTISDDGVGMDPDGIADFFRMGDSEKVRNPTSPKGRTKIGQFGIATVLLENLGSAYTLETWKDGTKLMLHEDFAHRNSELEYSIEPADTLVHGTTLSIQGLAFIKDSGFTEAQLRKVLGIEFRSVNDFSVEVNGKQVVQSSQSPTRTFPIDVDLPHAGRITGDIKYYKDGAPDPGIYIYVNTRAVGQPSFIDLSRVNFGLVGKVTGTIDADGLHKYITFDRSRLKEDNPATIELIQEIYHQLRNVRTELAHEKRSSERALSRTIVSSTLERIGSLMSTIDIRAFDSIADEARDRNLMTQLSLAGKRSHTDDHRLEFVVVDREARAGMAVYDKERSHIEINAGHPAFNVSMRGADYLLHVQFMYAAAVALGRGLTEAHAAPDAINYLNKRNRVFADLSQQVYGDRTHLLSFLESHTVFSDDTGDIRPLGMYTALEIKEIFGIDQAVLNKIITSGLLRTHRGELYIGSDILTLQKHLGGYVPACLIVKEYEEPRRNSRQAVEIFYKGIDDKLLQYTDQIEYVKNIGISKPFFIVESEQKQKFLSLYVGKHIRSNFKNIKVLPPELARRDFRPDEAMVSLYQAQRALGTNLEEVADIIDRARLNGHHIRMVRTNMGLRYNLSDMEAFRK